MTRTRSQEGLECEDTVLKTFEPFSRPVPVITNTVDSLQADASAHSQVTKETGAVPIGMRYHGRSKTITSVMMEMANRNVRRDAPDHYPWGTDIPREG